MVLTKRSIEKKQLRFARFVSTPEKVLLSGARDFSVNAFCACAGRIGEGSVVMTGFATLPHVHPMPGNYSGSNRSTKEKKSIESPRETIRAITTTNGGGRRKSRAAAESGSCQMGTIDEDAPCDFVETNGSKVTRICTQDAEAMHSSNRVNGIIGDSKQLQNT